MNVFRLLVTILIPRFSEASFGLKVPSLLPKEMELCLLRTLTLPSSGLKTLCSANCMSEPSCLLACRRGTECRLYKAAVSPNWSQSISAVPQEESGSCFSFWAEKRDIAPVTHFSTSSNFSDKDNIKGANDGFSCPLYNEMFYHSLTETNAWVLGDLSSPKWVERVVIQTRGNVGNNNWPSHFANVEVRVGNSKGTEGNFNANELLMPYAGSDFDYEKTITFKGERPLLGRYVSVQRLGYGSLGFMEMKIIVAP